MARYKIETTSQLHRHGYWLRVRCRACGHMADFSNDQLLELAKGRFVSGRIDQIVAHMRCSVCKAKPTDWAPTFPPDDHGPAPLGVNQRAWAAARDDRERKRLIRQARG